MKVAYLDGAAGISGDMTLGALVDAGVSLSKLRAGLKTLGVEGWTLSAKKVVKKGIAATKVTVRLTGEQKKHRHYPDIVKIVERSGLPDVVKKRTLKIFRIVAEAEGAVHGIAPEEVHFHEVGAVDAIIDIAGASLGFHLLGVDAVCLAPLNVGSGTVKCDHGVLPVPAPATALILAGVPTYADGPALELTTPTGAAIAKSFATSFGGQPPMVVENIAYGAGGHDLDDRANVVRLTIGETASLPAPTETITELAATIDDMNPEIYGYLTERLFAVGALDVTLTPVIMKKGRPGVVVSVLCGDGKSATLEEVLFAETTTLGVRRRAWERTVLPRRIETVKTKYGPVRVKLALLPDGSTRVAPEYDDVAKIASTKKVAFRAVYEAAKKMDRTTPTH